MHGFSILADVSPRILIGREGQTREEVLAEAGPSDRPTIVVLSVDMRKPKQANGE